MTHRHCLTLLAAALLAGSAAALLLPHAAAVQLFAENGFVERSTVALYLLAFVIVLGQPPQVLSWQDRLACCLLLAACAARELDLHTASFGISILKARFYNRDGTALQIAQALSILAPIGAAAAWLAWRHGRAWFAALRAGRADALPFALLLGTLVVAKLCDRAPATLADWHIATLGDTARILLQACEESLELVLPALAVAVATQGRATGAHALAARPGRKNQPAPAPASPATICVTNTWSTR